MKVCIVFTVAIFGFLAVNAYDLKVDEGANLLVGMRYMTDEVQTVLATATTLFRASTCKKHTGEAVNVSMILNNNPTWDPNNGVVYFYVVDDESKNESEALCHNHAPGQQGVAPYCIVPTWKSTNDLLVFATAGRVPAVSFTMNVIFTPKTVARRMEGMNRVQPRNHLVRFPTVQADVVYLKQIAEISVDQSLDYHTGVVLTVAFCPDSGTTSRYQIQSTVFGTDGTSSFGQFICNVKECSTESPDVIAFNGNQLPSNVVFVNTSHQQYSTIYVFVYGWGGEYNPATKKITGHFRYSASVSRT